MYKDRKRVKNSNIKIISEAIMQEKKQGESSPVKIKRRNLYYVLVSACALIVAAAIVLTVVFVTQGSPVDDPLDPGLEQPEDPDDGDDDEDGPDEPDEPSDTEVVFSMPVSDGTVATTYTFWFNSTLNRYNLHQGVDFKADAGTQVTAAYEGKIESVTDTLLEGGKVVIDHGNGLKTEYASIDVSTSLKVGDTVSQGTVIGTVSAAADTMGNEYNEGPHLHFGVFENGESIDPVTYLDLDEK